MNDELLMMLMAAVGMFVGYVALALGGEAMAASHAEVIYTIAWMFGAILAVSFIGWAYKWSTQVYNLYVSHGETA